MTVAAGLMPFAFVQAQESPELPVASEADPGHEPHNSPAVGSTAPPPENSGLKLDEDLREGPQWLHFVSDQAHDGVAWLARGIDGWFVRKDAPAEGDVRVSGRIILNTLWRQDEGWQSSGIKLRVSARLPNLENRAYIYFGQDNKDELVSDQPDNFSRGSRLLSESNKENQTFFAGLGVDLRRHFDVRVGFRGGLKPYIQGRYRRQWEVIPDNFIHFRSTLFWSARDSLGSTTGLQYEHVFTDSLSFRWDNSTTITRRSHGFDWYSSLGLFRTFGTGRELSFEVLASRDAEDKGLDVSEYGVRLGWRQPIYRDLLHLRLLGGHFWPRENSLVKRDKSWAAGASFELLF